VYRIGNAGANRLSVETQGEYTVTLKPGDTSQIKMDALPIGQIMSGQLKVGERAFYPIDVKVGEELFITVANSRKMPINLNLLDSKNRDLLIAAETTPAQSWSFNVIPGGESPHTLVLQLEGKYQIFVTKKSALTGDISLKVKSSTALKSGPNSTFNNAGNVTKDQVVTVLGRNSDGKWLMIVTADNDLGWLQATKIDMTDVTMDLLSLPEVQVYKSEAKP
jgi:hypothetical protein